MTDDIGRAKSERRPHGHIIIDGQEVANTMQCAHCGMHFISVRGSGTRRGFCLRCMQVTCGAKRCEECVPFEKRIEEYERGKRRSLLGAR